MRCKNQKMSFVVGAVLSVTMAVPIAQAAPSPATENLASVCGVTASITPSTVVHAGVPAAVAGEVLTFTQTVALEEGTLFQNALTLAGGTIDIGTFFELNALPSALVPTPGSFAFSLGGVPIVPTVAAGPIASGWSLMTDTSVPGTTTWRVYAPGDVPAILAANTGVGVPSVVIPAGGQDLVMSYTASVPAAGYALGEVLDGAECFAKVSTGPTNRETDRTVA